MEAVVEVPHDWLRTEWASHDTPCSFERPWALVKAPRGLAQSSTPHQTEHYRPQNETARSSDVAVATAAALVRGELMASADLRTVRREHQLASRSARFRSNQTALDTFCRRGLSQ